MYCATTLDNLPLFHAPIALTIGNFDGVHLGHKALFNAMQQQVYNKKGSRIVISFLNHPSQVLRPNQSITTLCSLEHKIALIERAGIDALILLDFTAELAAKSAQEFLGMLRTSIRFDFLFLGPDGTIGKNREGDRDKLSEIALQDNFKVIYLPQVQVNQQKVSSTAIRELIAKGDLFETERLLGRPFSIYSRVISGMGKGRVMGTPTANFPVEGLCLPPLGVWIASAKIGDEWLPAIANLGHAPTLRQDGRKLLEVYLLNQNRDLLDQGIEVRFHAFLRPEQKFADMESLKAQIREDVEAAKSYWAK